jgi:transposase InsO family protein
LPQFHPLIYLSLIISYSSSPQSDIVLGSRAPPGPYPKRQTKKQAWNTDRKEKQTGQKDTERRNYSKEFKAGAAALAEKREKPISRTAGGLGANGSVLRRDCGKRAGLKKAACLPRENGLNARRRGNFVPAARPNRRLPVCANPLNREFRAAAAGEKRVPDLFGRKAIGRAFGSDTETVRTALPALRTAFARRTARERLLFPSGRGSHFKTLKRELETLDGKHSAAEAGRAVFMYLEAYYNRLRLHLALGYGAPVIFNSGRAA